MLLVQWGFLLSVLKNISDVFIELHLMKTVDSVSALVVVNDCDVLSLCVHCFKVKTNTTSPEKSYATFLSRISIGFGRLHQIHAELHQCWPDSTTEQPDERRSLLVFSGFSQCFIYIYVSIYIMLFFVGWVMKPVPAGTSSDQTDRLTGWWWWSFMLLLQAADWRVSVVWGGAVLLPHLPHQVVVFVQVDVFGGHQAPRERPHLCPRFDPGLREDPQSFSCRTNQTQTSQRPSLTRFTPQFNNVTATGITLDEFLPGTELWAMITSLGKTRLDSFCTSGHKDSP